MVHKKTVQDHPVSRDLLPAAALRWLERALPPNFELPTSISIQQEGKMDVRGVWTPFEARGVYKAPPLSFNWRAKLRMGPGIWVLAEDGHLDSQGWGGARLWGVIPMGKRTDPQVLNAQLVRNLGELAWLPPFALVDPGLTWSDAGENAFDVRVSAGDQTAVVNFEIDDRSQVIRASSPARPYDIPGGYEVAPWSYEFDDHFEIGGVRVPGTAIARFDKEDGPLEYFHCKITDVIW